MGTKYDPFLSRSQCSTLSIQSEIRNTQKYTPDASWPAGVKSVQHLKASKKHDLELLVGGQAESYVEINVLSKLANHFCGFCKYNQHFLITLVFINL